MAYEGFMPKICDITAYVVRSSVHPTPEIRTKPMNIFICEYLKKAPKVSKL